MSARHAAPASTEQSDSDQAAPARQDVPLPRRLLAELVGTWLLVLAIVGSGVAAVGLTADDGLRLLVNALATAVTLGAVIAAVGPVSGAHLNPAVTLVALLLRGLRPRAAAGYVAVQLLGGMLGAVTANVLFDLDAVQVAGTVRGADLWFSEVVATLGLVLVIFGVVRSGRVGAAPLAIAAYVGGAIFFTPSTAFANPAVTVGRILTDTFTGISPLSAPGFVAAQLVGALLAFLLVRMLYPDVRAVAGRAVIPPAGPPPS